MNIFRLLACSVALAAVVSCSHSPKQEVAPTGAPTTAVRSSRPATPAVAKPATPAATPATPGLSAEATKAEAAKVVPVAPGLRVSRVKVPGMYVALTFDDGPHPTLTPKALDILRRHNAHCTFFVVGQNAKAHPGILARAVADGNEVGVHTWSHIKMTGSSQEKIDREVGDTVSVITSATGKAPLVMRPPYGATNASIVNHMKSAYNMRSILWDVDTLDWRHPGVQKVINTAVSQAKPGSIILIHDIHASTLAALEGIVTGLQARGFKLVTVSELIALGNQAAGQSATASPAVPAEPAAATPQPTETTAPIATAPEATAPVAETQPVATETVSEMTPVATQPAVETPAPASESTAATITVPAATPAAETAPEPVQTAETPAPATEL